MWMLGDGVGTPNVAGLLGGTAPRTTVRALRTSMTTSLRIEDSTRL